MLHIVRVSAEMPLYFAYGSNMKTSRIMAADRCPGAEFLCVAKLPGHRLAFTRKSKDGHGVADALEVKNGVVWGVVWRLTTAEIDRLDKREGAKAAQPKYVRRPVSVQPLGDVEMLACDSYFVADDQREEFEVPSTKKYLGYLLDGAREHKLPRHYITKLLSLWRVAQGD